MAKFDGRRKGKTKARCQLGILNKISIFQYLNDLKRTIYKIITIIIP